MGRRKGGLELEREIERERARMLAVCQQKDARKDVEYLEKLPIGHLKHAESEESFTNLAAICLSGNADVSVFV